ncbi:hypothetical protein CYMTET_46298 [Cymbomonas tetramitiformis]|uniref:Uncharacterized protein n=1 Tax=Cymbomonas tetramitiformis TaxID=36881 RepID=A0AAE0BYH8_9CHLO|nr:hypothetical protein CYMTET_54306 [Cymbomonas tetramitiformis]KAK3244077.1 hypothetical protein CYMTET_46298 [Cymbomonas tetramitiformis]
MRKFSREEQRMLDARCKALVEAGALQPRSVAQTELTGRIRLHAEDLRGEWSTPEELVATTPGESAEQKGRTVAQTDPDHPDLTRDQEARASDSEYLSASAQPWLGMAVNPWCDETGSGSWTQQRLFVDRTGYARLCKLYGKPEEMELEPGYVRVTFARCGEEKDVVETELLWPDFTLVDQKINKETKVASDTWVTRARWKKDSDPVVPPDCQVHRDAGRHTMAAVQESLNVQQVYPTGVVTGTLMWDKRGHQFCVLSEKTRAHWELIMERLVRHTEGDSERMSPMGSVSGEFQLPFYYEKDQRWCHQPLKHVQKVDIVDLRARLRMKYDEVGVGWQTGGSIVGWAIWPCLTSIQWQRQTEPLRLRHQMWLNEPFDPETMQPHTFQGTYEAESDTNSVDATIVSKWLDGAHVAELSRKDGQTVFLDSYKQMHRYAYSAAQGQRNAYLPLGGQSAGCSGGLLGTIRQHFEDMLGGEDLTDLARRHMDAGLQQGTLHVLMTRATPRAKPVYYVFEAQEFYHKHASVLWHRVQAGVPGRSDTQV